MGLTDRDRRLAERALALARKGCFQVEPNPPVGCVIDRDDAGVVGEGWHAAWGGPHAEVSALRRAGRAARGATAYVSLGPCGRTGKTPACADALIRAGVERVVYVTPDPHPEEAAGGIARLRDAGVQVDGPVPGLEEAAEALLARFRRSLEATRPWTVLKWAMSLDGRITGRRGSGGPISGARARRLVHRWRAHADAVAVGVETVLADDPLLTCRLADGPPDDRPQPLRVVFDSSLRIPVDRRLLGDLDNGPVMVVTTGEADRFKRRALEDRGVLVRDVPAIDGRPDLAAASRMLAADGVRRLLLEGGARLHGAFLRAGLADQVSVFVAPTVLGGPDPVTAVEHADVLAGSGGLRLADVAWRRVDDDILLQGYVPGR